MIVELCGSSGNGSVGLSDGSHMEEGTVATIIVIIVMSSTATIIVIIVMSSTATIIVIKVVVNAVGDGGRRKKKKRKRKREKECDYERVVKEMRKRRGE